MSLPNELIARIASFLEVNGVRNVIISCAGYPQMIEIVKRDYLKGNLHYLLSTNSNTCWEKRKANTLTWMKFNDWKKIFYYQNGFDSNNNENSPMHNRYHHLFAHECCKPFYDLTSSVERGIIEVTQYLLQQGADVNRETIVDDLHFEYSFRPINAALTIPCVEMLELLLSRNETEVLFPFQRTFGNNILHFAAGDENVSCKHLSILLSKMTTAEINSTDSIGKTALHYICWFLTDKCEEKAELLLKAGAHVNAFGLDYLNPLQVVQLAGPKRRKNIDEMETLLKSYGAFEVRIGP